MSQFFNSTVLPAMQWLFLVLWAFAPMFFANMAPPGVRVVIIRLNLFLTGKNEDLFNSPVYVRVFGQNKTWRGLISAVVVGALVSLIQYSLRNIVPYMQPFVLAEQSISIALTLGALQGLGAMIGDMVESAIKRSRFVNIQPGERWPVYDQIDCGIGAYVLLLALSYFGLLVFPSVWESLGILVWLLIFSAYLIPMANKTFHHVGLKEKPH